jgi:signal peptidase
MRMSSSISEKLSGRKRDKKKNLTPAEKKKQQKKGILKGVAIIAIAILGTWGFYQIMIVASGTDYPMVVVISPSMVPEINVGDLLFVHYVAPEDIKSGTIQNLQGDVILYNSQGLWGAYAQSDPIVHRVVGKYFNSTDGEWYFITKGDANPDTDPPGLPDKIPVPQDHVIGVVYGRIPDIGWIKIWLTDTDAAIPIMVILGALLLITIIYDAIHPEEEETKDSKKVKKMKGKGRSDIPPAGSAEENPEAEAETWGYEDQSPERPPGDSNLEGDEDTNGEDAPSDGGSSGESKNPLDLDQDFV